MNIETIKAKQAELEKLIEQFQKQTTIVEIQERTIKLNPGEHYAGAVLDADGNHVHDLILLPQRHGKRVNLNAALEWAEEVGGALPTRQELTLIHANCKPHLEGVYHWSCEEYEGSASSAWACCFDDGNQGTYRKLAALSAVAVRRV